MKKTLTIRTISFNSQFGLKEDSSLQASCRLTSQVETATTERQIKAFKLAKKTDQPYARRLTPKNTQKSNFNPTESSQKDKIQRKHLQNKGNMRYSKMTYCQQTVPNQTELSSHHFRKVNSLTEPSKRCGEESNKFRNSAQLSKARIQSQPNSSKEIKKQLRQRVAKKIEFMRRLTMKDELQTCQTIQFTKPKAKEPEPAKLYNFDKMYDFCLKKLNKDISRYQKDADKLSDKKYYELKQESNILTKELVQIRRSIAQKQKIPQEQSQHTMGIVGNFIGLTKNCEKTRLQIDKKTMNSLLCGKRRPNSGNDVTCNPFTLDSRGWQVREKQEYSFLC